MVLAQVGGDFGRVRSEKLYGWWFQKDLKDLYPTKNAVFLFFRPKNRIGFLCGGQPGEMPGPIQKSGVITMTPTQTACMVIREIHQIYYRLDLHLFIPPIWVI